MQELPKQRIVINSTFPKCPVCNVRWYEQINDGSTDIVCSGCGNVWGLIKGC